MSDIARRRNVLVRNRMFRRMWTARAISFIGDGIAITALVLHVESANGTGTAVGALLLAQALPHLAGPMAGVVADRTDQRRLMIACNVGDAVVFAVAASLLPALPGLLLLVATSSTLDTIFGPAGRSAIPALVDEDDLLSANAWLGTALNMQVAIGPLLGGLFVATLGIRGALIADAASFLVSAALLLRVQPLPPQDDRLRNGGASSRIPGRAWPTSAVTRSLGRSWSRCSWASPSPASTTSHWCSSRAMSSGPDPWGSAWSRRRSASGCWCPRSCCRAAGAVPRERSSSAAGSSTAVGTLLTGLAPAIWLAALAQATGGAGNGADNVASDTLIQRSVPRELLGRVFGVTSTAAFVGGGIAYAAGGVLLDATSPRFVFLFAGVGVLAVVGLAHVMLPREP